MLDADEQLAVAKGLREGRGEAWTALFDAYAQDAWRYASHLAGGDREATCEVVQESFLAAARAARSFDPTRGSLKAWLLGIVHLQTVQHFRRRRRELANGQALSGDRRAMLDSGAPSPAAEALQRETAEQVRRVLAEMPSDYAWLLAAKYIDERPIAALADELSAEPEAVRSKLARARRLFRSAMTHQRVKR